MCHFKMLGSLFALVSALGAAIPPCGDLPGVNRLWSNSRVRFILAGEIHGTNETPAIFGDLACAAGTSNRPIVVGIEHSVADQEAIDAFMSSSDHEAAVRTVLSRRTWTTFDGRSSGAMLILFEKLRALKARGPPPLQCAGYRAHGECACVEAGFSGDRVVSIDGDAPSTRRDPFTVCCGSGWRGLERNERRLCTTHRGRFGRGSPRRGSI